VNSARRLIKISLLAMLATIGFDLFLHSGVLSGLYSKPSPFLLPSEQAFQFIPVGYLAFLLLIVLLMWLMPKLSITGWRPGLAFGLKLGALVWGSLTLALLSISTASPILMVAWFLGQTIELGIAGMVCGSGLGSTHLRSLVIRVSVFFVTMVVLSLVLQNIGNF